MKGLLLVLISLASLHVEAGLILAPRYEFIRGREDELANRVLLKSKLNYSKSLFSFYAEGFGELETNEDQAFVRRSPSRGYLQEAYVEIQKDSVFIRVGRQPLRWSEMWSIPSLDVWTGRRWNRLFFDPFADQLTHSTAALMSYARETWSLDLVGTFEVAENSYPVPISQEIRQDEGGIGVRLKKDLKGFALSAMAAQVQKVQHFGGTINYAFDHAVPKFEIGYSDNSDLPSGVKSDQTFYSAGMDLFLGNWVVLPQVSYFEIANVNPSQYEAAYYLSAQWNPNRHDVFFQIFQNVDRDDLFANMSYGYNVTDSFTTSVFVQSYAGKLPGLYNYYEEITGGWVAGLRLEFTGELSF